MKTITVIGAGFTGLAVAYELAKKGRLVRLFDPKGLGGGASGVSAGLLHPFTGPHAKLTWKGYEGLAAAKELLEVAGKALGRSVAKADGILRVAMTQRQRQDFQAASAHEHVDWLEECFIKPYPGIFIRDGIAVDVKAYLAGLWLACEALGVTLIEEKVEKIEGPAVITAGFDSLSFLELPLTPVKGQILQLAWPKDIEPLPYPINGGVYIVMGKESKSCWVGATFERLFTHEGVDLEEATREILPKAAALIPELASAEILDCQAGIRASTPNRLPLMKQFGEDRWVLTGMGSKGLLYHALLAKELASLVKST